MSKDMAGGEERGLRIYLLGGFRVLVGQRPIAEREWRLRKARSLLKLLALAPYHRLHREQILDQLWPDLEPEAALNNLHRVLHALRHVLEPSLEPLQPSTYIHFQEEDLALSPLLPVWIDVEQFEAARNALYAAQQPAAYQAALALYNGELLPEDRYEDWVIHRRTQLRQSYLNLLNDLARLHLAREEKDAAIETLQKLVTEEPALEEAHAQLMQLYSKTGQRYYALRQYQQLREALRRQLDADPSQPVQRLYRDIQAGRFSAEGEQLPARAPERTKGATIHYTSSGRQSNLPHALTSFIGREQEMGEIGRLLARTRLMTLTGAGGSGKTRLALQAAEALSEAFADGICLVELAAVSDPSLVPQTIASALNVHEAADAPLPDSLLEALRPRHMLLVLDNCEHLVEACARLAYTLLQGCPRLHMLVTSRQGLGIMGEVAWRVPSLAVPDLERLPPFEQLPLYDAVRLFTERASASRPDFLLTAENAAAVIQICCRLDGMPLAIELAAVRVKMLSVGQIAARLDDALALLVTGNRMAQRRQQTLRATYEWSYALLSEQERMLFRRLSVFAGGWTLEAAQQVCAEPPFHMPSKLPATQEDGVAAFNVFDLLAQLVDKSLVIVAESRVQGEGGQARYALLETLRQYGAEQLAVAGETVVMRKHHLECYLAMAEAAESELRGPKQGAWIERLEMEHDNLRAALSWANKSRAKEQELRLAGALWLFCSLRGYLSEGRRWLEAALTGKQSDVERGSERRTEARAKALRGASVLAYEQADFGRAAILAEESLMCYGALGDLYGSAGVLNNLGIIAIQQEDYTRAETLCQESLALAREAMNEPLIATVLNNLGVIAGNQDYLAGATLFYKESLAQYRALGDKDGIARAFINLGEIALKQNDYREAASLYHDGLTLARELGSKELMAYGLEGLAGSISAQAPASTNSSASSQEPLPGSSELMLLAAQLWGAAQELRSIINAPLTPADIVIYERHVAAARARWDAAAFSRAWAEGRAIPLEQVIDAGLALDIAAISAYAPSSTSASISPEPATGNANSSISLTRREREVATLIATGDTNRAIAAKLAISERTVENHVARILARLRLGSRAQIAVWVVKQQTLL